MNEEIDRNQLLNQQYHVQGTKEVQHLYNMVLKNVKYEKLTMACKLNFT